MLCDLALRRVLVLGQATLGLLSLLSLLSLCVVSLCGVVIGPVHPHAPLCVCDRRTLACDPQCATGARWGLDGAEAVLKLRALVGNGDFDDYSAFHLKQEKTRNHDSRYQ